MTDDPLAHLWDGEHVRLRDARPDDVDDVEGWHRDPRLSWFASPGPPYPGLPRQKYLKAIEEPSGPNHCRFTVTTLNDDAAIGVAGLGGYALSVPRGRLFVSLSPDHWGKGYGTDAVRILCRYGFDGLGLHRIFLGVFDFNDRAVAAYRSAGFVEEGRIREYWFRGGTWHDDVHMSLLASEWRARQ